jgi:hypothetical protein
MPNSVVEMFTQALRDAEQNRDSTRLTELFAENAELSSLPGDEPRRGKAGPACSGQNTCTRLGKSGPK